MRAIRFVCDACLLMLFVALRCVAGMVRIFLGVFLVGSRKSAARTRPYDGMAPD